MPNPGDLFRALGLPKEMAREVDADSRSREIEGESGGRVIANTLSGEGAPSSDTGDNGQAYIDVETGDLYGLKTGGVWPSPTSLIGEPGTPGEDGDDGAPGEDGDDGAPGADGDDGAPGEDGDDGAPGTNGNTVLSGTASPPGAGIGVDGDWYLNSLTYLLYGPKASGAWPAGVSLSAASSTTAAIDLYVNAATGNDTTGDGTLALPYATIAKAQSIVPRQIKHTVTIHTYAGTYAETIFDGSVYNGSSGSLIIQGEDFTTPTLGSGSITSGTLGTLSGTSRPVAGAAWTVNELRGMLIKITSGSFNGRYYPIVGNTAAGIEIGHMSTTPNGATFSIVQPAVIITKAVGVNYSAYVVNNGNIGNGLIIKRCALQSTSTGMYVAAGAGHLSECVVSGGSKGVVMNGPNTVLEVWASYVTASSSAAEIVQGGAFYTPASCFHGAVATILIGTLGFWGLSGSAISAALWVQSGSTGITVTGTCSFNWGGAATRSSIRNHSSTGIAISGQARGSVSTVDITFCTNQGISFDMGSGGSGHSSLQLSSTKIQNSFRGIKFSSTHNCVVLTSASDISACTTAGVQFSANSSTNAPAFNSIQFATTTTTSGNTAGDITMDGSSFDSLANLRLDADKTFIDSVRFNRAVAD